MRRVAALYDIHGNLPALEAVLEEVGREGVDGVVVGGDVLPGPMPTEVLDCLRALEVPVHYLRGNGERETLAIREGHEPSGLPSSVVEVLRWNASRLTEDYATWLRSWPGTVSLEIGGVGPVLFCHATPERDDEVFTRLTAERELAPLFGRVAEGVVVCGHTHMQFDRAVGSVRVVNAGSVGMPFAEPGAYWLLLGDELELRRTEYDLAGAAERIRRTPYPQAEEFAATEVLHPRSEAEVLDLFERMAVKRNALPS